LIQEIRMQKMFHNVAQSFARHALGCELVPQWRMERLAQTAYLHKLLTSLQVDCVFDVGANQGQFREYLRTQVGYAGRIISFEPNPNCASRLQEQAGSDPQWTVRPVALGEQAGQLAFHLTRDSQFSSFLPPTQANAKMAGNVVERIIDVELSTLDREYPELQERFGFSRPFLKLDTQGYELHILRGGAAVVPGFHALQAEVSNVAIYDGSTIEAFKACGFKLAHLFPTNPDHFPVAIDFDAYFINNKYQPIM
jgi:FkbM family methyltransferase